MNRSRTTVTKTNQELRDEYFPTRAARGQLELKWSEAVHQEKAYKLGGPEPTVILTEEEKQAVWLSFTSKAFNRHFSAFHRGLPLCGAELSTLEFKSKLPVYDKMYDALVKQVLMVAEMMAASKKGLAWAYSAYSFRYREMLHQVNLRWAGFSLTDYEIKQHIRVHRALQQCPERPSIDKLLSLAFQGEKRIPKARQIKIVASSLALLMLMEPFCIDQEDVDKENVEPDPYEQLEGYEDGLQKDSP